MSGLYNWVTSAATPTESAATPTEPEDVAATPSDAIRRSARVLNKNNLAVPAPEPRRISPQERLRIRAGRQSSPSPTASTSFSFPPTRPSATMDEETVQRLMEAAIRATSSTSTSQVQSLKKPELPNFDKNNIDIWIKRVEAAYTRVNVSDPKLKFAHLENKFDVNADPLINEFLFETAPTAATWTAFLSYLRKRYGRTTKQQAQSVISGTPRDGRTPSQLVALMKERAGTVTLDDILKEQLLKELPPEVHRQIVDKVDSLTFEQTGELADKWFDKEGKQLLADAPASVNNVNTSFTAAFEDDSTDINVTRARQGQKQRFNNANSRPQGKDDNRYSNSSRSSNSRSSVRNAREDLTVIKDNGLCGFHDKYDRDAFKCASGCKRWSAHQAKNGQASKQ